MPMSLENRARLAARNRETRVWLLSKNSGAKSPEGRRRVGQNALKHGARHASMGAVAGWVKSIKALLTDAT
jgi:hypothetical protein